MRQISSLLQGLARSLSVGKERKGAGEDGGDRKTVLLRTSGTLWGEGSETFVAVCSRLGEKGTNQDCSIVWEGFGCQEGTIFCGSISLELFGIIMAPGSSTKQIWNAINNLFRDNKKSRSIALEAEFRDTPQGDMSINDYCAKLKTLFDALGDVGQPVSNETLVLTMLRSLNEQFSHLRSFIPFQVPIPSFLQTRSALILEEAQKKTNASNAAATTLWASGNSVMPSAGGERSPPSGGGRSHTNTGTPPTNGVVDENPRIIDLGDPRLVVRSGAKTLQNLRLMDTGILPRFRPPQRCNTLRPALC